MTSPAGWEVLEQIGVGAHAVVHRAVRRDRPGRVVALKRLHDADPRRVAELEREAAILAELAHPAIAVLHEVLVEPDGIALVLGLATGGSLAERLVRDGALPWWEVADLGARLAGGLAAAHDAGVVHRDVKPSNILFGREDEPRLADFGLARLVADEPDVVAGTAGYVDPDVVDGAAPGPRSDLWSLGVVLWEALAGQPPFAGADPDAVVAAADRGAHLPLADLAPDAPGELVAAIERAMARDPAERLAGCRELEGVLAGVANDPGPQRDPPVDEDGSGRASTAEGGHESPGTAAGRAVPTGAETPTSPTVTWGPRPPRATPDEPPERPARRRWLVGVLVLLPLVVAGWALLRATVRPSVGDPGSIRALHPIPSSAPGTPDPGVADPPAGPPSALLDGWRPRIDPRPCPGPGPEGAVPGGWWADVDGQGCAVAVQSEPAGDGRRTLRVAGESDRAGLWDVGPDDARVAIGDWDGDGIDTPALARDGRLWVFGDWTDGQARPAGSIGSGALAVVTDRSGRDHVVLATDLGRAFGHG